MVKQADIPVISATPPRSRRRQEDLLSRGSDGTAKRAKIAIEMPIIAVK